MSRIIQSPSLVDLLSNPILQGLQGAQRCLSTFLALNLRVDAWDNTPPSHQIFKVSRIKIAAPLGGTRHVHSRYDIRGRLHAECKALEV